MTRPGIEPRSPGPLVNILLIRPMPQALYFNLKLKVLKRYILQTRRLEPHFQMHFNVIPRALYGFKYCYLTLIILSNINHLFTHSSDGFKHCYLTTIDPHPLPSNTYKIKHGWICCHKSNLRNMVGTIK